MQPDQETYVLQYFNQIAKATALSQKLAALKDVLFLLFSESDLPTEALRAFTASNTFNLIPIPLPSWIKTNTKSHTIILGFFEEDDLQAPHVVEAMQHFYQQQMQLGERVQFLLVASNFIDWQLFQPIVASLEQINEWREGKTFIAPSYHYAISENNTVHFPEWFSQNVLLQSQYVPSEADMLYNFGPGSLLFTYCCAEFADWFAMAKKYGDAKMSFEHWKQLQPANIPPTLDRFISQTYASVLCKLLAYAHLQRPPQFGKKVMKMVLDGSFFPTNSKLVEHDCFYWVSNGIHFKNVYESILHLLAAISRLQFTEIPLPLDGLMDVLENWGGASVAISPMDKPVLERLAAKIPLKSGQKIVDVACKKGALLRALQQMGKQPDNDAHFVLPEWVGIDPNPLYIQIARTEYYLRYSNLSNNTTPAIHFLVANVAFIPAATVQLFGGALAISFGDEVLALPLILLETEQFFNNCLVLCAQLVQGTKDEVSLQETIQEELLLLLPNGGWTNDILNAFKTLLKAYQKAASQGYLELFIWVLTQHTGVYFLQQSAHLLVWQTPDSVAKMAERIQRIISFFLQPKGHVVIITHENEWKKMPVLLGKQKPSMLSFHVIFRFTWAIGEIMLVILQRKKQKTPYPLSIKTIADDGETSIEYLVTKNNTLKIAPPADK